MTDLPTWPTVNHHTLESGLQLVTVPLPHLHLASVVLFVRVGSRYETVERNGLSHLLEHVLFRGCEAYPDTYALNTAIERVASGVDAATSRDFTTFEASCRPADTADVLNLLGAMLSEPLLREADVEIEKRIIHEELQDELDTRGRDVDIDNLAKAALFGDSSMGLKVGGQLARVGRFTAADCRAWHEENYGAANMVLVVTGPIDPEVVRAAAEIAFARLPLGTRRDPRPARLVAELPAFIHADHDGPQVDVQLQWCLPSESDPDWPALFVIQRLLDDGTCARLRHRIVDQLGLAYHASADLESYEGLSILSIHTQTRPSQVLAVVDAIYALVDELALRPVADSEITRIHARLRLELASVSDSASSIAWWFGVERLFDGLDGLPRRLERAFAVTPAAIAEVAARRLHRGAVLLAAVGELEPVARAALRRRVKVARGALSGGA
jgi:predicted Zn-dependent peptidase